MDTKKIKSSELVIIKKILAWQVAQVIGSQSEEELNKPIPVTLDDGRVIEVLTSIGYSHDIDSADKALYYVKKNGKNHFHKGE
ncbi:MAG: hypothetical protein K5694_00915 [Bacilli bacterium]|nr:hypothetical protein [Bacilli bacterium]